MDVREKLIEILRKPIFPHELVDPIEAVTDYLLDSGVTVQEHGQWETSSDRPDSLICSVCKRGFDMWKHDPHNYCPNCGAKMQEVD